jgi:hypothetical protein
MIRPLSKTPEAEATFYACNPDKIRPSNVVVSSLERGVTF